MKRILRYLETEIKKGDIQILDTGEYPEAPQPREMIGLEVMYMYTIYYTDLLSPVIHLLPNSNMVNLYCDLGENV